MTAARRPVDLAAYEARARQGPCFVCAFVAGDPEYGHVTLHEDEEHVVRDLDEAAYTRLPAYVRLVALVMEDVLAPERTYLLSLGSAQGNARLHWHIAGLPAEVPYERQQFHALMSENGVLTPPPDASDPLAARLREACVARFGGRSGWPDRPL